MARKVKVSSVGKQPPRYLVEEKPDSETLVQDMVDFWKAQIEQVLPDRPDLIVLPENCDRYFGTPREFEIEVLDDYFARSLAHHHEAANREADEE